MSGLEVAFQAGKSEASRPRINAMASARKRTTKEGDRARVSPSFPRVNDLK